MPIFEFKCHTCADQVERLQKHNEPPPTCGKCPDSPMMIRMVSRSSFRLKGTGWAHDGYGGNH